MFEDTCNSTQKLQCIEENGKKMWIGNDINADSHPKKTICPMNSIPWRHKLVCDNDPNPTKCYKTGDKAVCAITSNDTLNKTEYAKTVLKSSIPLSRDEKISIDEVKQNYVPCFVQPFSSFKNASIVSYVKPDDLKTCNSMIESAQNLCNGKECEKIERLYKSSNATQFSCSLDVNHIPINKDEWWNWKRTEKFKCDENGTLCKHKNLHVKEQCNLDKDCDADYEVGICDMNKNICTTGSSIGKRCNTSEDCDQILKVEGKCENNKCKSGKTNISAVYNAPKSCKIQNKDTKFTYCGENKVGNTTQYHGICTEYEFESKKYHGCKAFESNEEIEKIKDLEIDWQGHLKKQNFYQDSPKWDNLRVCEQNNGFCSYTTEAIPLYEDDIITQNEKLAKNVCSKKYNLDISQLSVSER